MHCVKSGNIQSYSVRMWENTDQNNSEYKQFSRSDTFRVKSLKLSVTKFSYR